MSSEDVLAREEAVKHLDMHTPMALESYLTEIPSLTEPVKEEPKPKRKRLTPEERAARDAAKVAERERKKAQRAAERAAARTAAQQARIEAKRAEAAAKLAEAQGSLIELPAVVLRDGTVRPVSLPDALAVCDIYLDDMCLDVEHSGYPLGHKFYELRTIQLGGEQMAVVLDATDELQRAIASYALQHAEKLRAHSAIADVIPVVEAGLISWDDAWGKMHDSVLYAKLTDPKMSGSDADALKELAHQLLREYAVSPAAEKAKNNLFKVMKCLTKPDLTTPPEKNGWYSVDKRAEVMIRYAGSDVLDLAAVLRILPPLPVENSVLDSEREFQAACATVAWTGFALDHEHITKKIAEEEAAREAAREAVEVLSDGKITNPKSTDVLKFLPEVIPGLVLPPNRKSGNPSADKGSLEGLARDYKDNPLAFHLFKQILAYRHHDTTLGLLLRPLNMLCEHGDARMRPTVYTIEASTGRTSCRRPNGQQFSRQGGVRACVTAGTANLELIDGQWVITSAN